MSHTRDILSVNPLCLAYFFNFSTVHFCHCNWMYWPVHPWKPDLQPGVPDSESLGLIITMIGSSTLKSSAKSDS